MISDPTLARETPQAHRRAARHRGTCGSRRARRPRDAAGTALRLASGGPRRRRPRHRGSHPRPFDRRGAQVVSGRAGRAGDLAGPRPDVPATRRESIRDCVPGFATEAGGRASHTAIVAAALEIPAVVGLGKFLDRAQHCRMAIIDGDEGLVILDPDFETQERYRKTAAERTAWFEVLTQEADLPAETDDGTRIELWGNIEFGGEVEACLERGAVGVGLFRTEFLFLNAETPPSEQEQFEAYASVVRSMGGRPIVIRTLDLGADKLADSIATPARMNRTRPWVCGACGCRYANLVFSVPSCALAPRQRAGRAPDSVSAGVDTCRTEGRAGRAQRRCRRAAGGRARRPRKPACRRHGGGTGSRPDGGSSGKGGGFLFYRNQRLDSVHAGR